ncbi:hypothetical protein ABZP36_024354 [Zizania latifolia]
MGGFVDPFMTSAAWSQDIVFTGTSWDGGASSLTDPLPSYGAGAQAVTAVDGVPFPGEAAPSPAKLYEQLLLQAELQQSDGLGFATDDCAAVLGSMHSAPVICSSSNESSGSEQSALPGFLVGEQHVPASAAWPAAYAGIPSPAGEETQQSFGFGRISNGDLLQEANRNKYQQLHDDIDFDTAKLLSFAPGQEVTPNIDNLQIDQKAKFQEFSGLHHLNLSSLISGPLASFSPAQSQRQFTEVCSGKNGSASPPVNLSDVPNGNMSGENGAPKPRVRARRGQATDPHSIAERLRREKISDRMKNLQELVPNSNRTDKASMLDEIIDYVKFLQLQVKVLSMSRLGATEAVVPLLTEPQTESSGLLLSPRSGERQARAEVAGTGAGLLGQSELQDGAAFEQEVVQMMENNMTTAMQYLQSKGLCLMPVALASAISTQKGTSSAAIRPENGRGGGKEDVKGSVDALKPPLGSSKEMKSRA